MFHISRRLRHSMRDPVTRVATASKQAAEVLARGEGNNILLPLGAMAANAAARTTPKTIAAREASNISGLYQHLFQANPRVITSINAPARAIFESRTSCEVLPVAADAEGVLPSALDAFFMSNWPKRSPGIAPFDQQANGARPQFLYTGTTTMTSERIRELYATCVKHDLILVEANTSDSPTLRRLDEGSGRVLKTHERAKPVAALRGSGVVGQVAATVRSHMHRKKIDQQLSSSSNTGGFSALSA